ncbi:hypothetical protein C8J57DRAFT_1497537 [Mycena rebaudengoi]|nr:hypothetical protein C8J57DRAFT_1497537 [Mycena rebaudengoi]
MPCLEPSALRLITLPLELLLDIAAYLSVYWSPSASRDIRSLSRVNHQLRQLCLPLLFSYLKCRTPERLLRLEQKLASDRGFAKLIRTLNIKDVTSDPTRQLLTIVPRLESLSYLFVHPAILDVLLLAAINRHPNLATVAVRDPHLKLLSTSFPNATPSLFSKLSLNCANMAGELLFTIHHSPTAKLITTSGLRIQTLILHRQSVQAGGDALGEWRFRGLEELHLGMREPHDWLSDFIKAHPDLRTIRFHTRTAFKPWCPHAFVLCGAQIWDALHAEGLQHAVSLGGIAISRTPLSQEDWKVTELYLNLELFVLDVLRLASRFYSSVSVLTLKLALQTTLHIDEFIDALSQFPLLRRLELVEAHTHLTFGDQRPWEDAHEPKGVARQSGCVASSAAMHWFLTRIARRLSSVEILKHYDEGSDWNGLIARGGSWLWTMEALYHVGGDSGGPKLVGNAKLVPSEESEDWD